jgi:hypothetical protein
VGIGASITGASRAVLLRALALCESPIYCDTDSIVCEYLPPELCHPSRLGAWDIEFSATQHPALIAGKKMYAFIDDDGQHHVSSKGVTFNRDQIAAMVNGEIVENIQAAPMFSARSGGEMRALKRMIKMRSFSDVGNYVNPFRAC